MAIERVGALNPQVVDRLVQRTKSNEQFKAEVIAELFCIGAREFLEKTFHLDERQRAEVELLRDKGSEEIFGRALITALLHNGSIQLIHEGHSPPNLRIEIGLGGRDGYGVKVYC